jgi:hypothetical protein
VENAKLPGAIDPGRIGAFLGQAEKELAQQEEEKGISYSLIRASCRRTSALRASDDIGDILSAVSSAHHHCQAAGQ